jgi:hypothetical protein
LRELLPSFIRCIHKILRQKKKAIANEDYLPSNTGQLGRFMEGPQLLSQYCAGIKQHTDEGEAHDHYLAKNGDGSITPISVAMRIDDWKWQKEEKGEDLSMTDAVTKTEVRTKYFQNASHYDQNLTALSALVREGSTPPELKNPMVCVNELAKAWSPVTNPIPGVDEDDSQRVPCEPPGVADKIHSRRDKLAIFVRYLLEWLDINPRLHAQVLFFKITKNIGRYWTTEKSHNNTILWHCSLMRSILEGCVGGPNQTRLYTSIVDARTYWDEFREALQLLGAIDQTH